MVINSSWKGFSIGITCVPEWTTADMRSVDVIRCMVDRCMAEWWCYFRRWNLY